MTPKQQAYAATAESLIKKLNLRHMEGHYFNTKEEALEAILKLIPEGSTVANGGSVSINEIGLLPAIKSGNYNYIDRYAPQTDAEKKECFSKTVSADYYLMSTNAITLDGQLVNIDGAANRVACLAHGPENVIIVAGMNKLAKTVDEAINRVHTYACPANTVRLGLDTPCAKTGVCADCLSDACICCEILITRNSRIPGRIKVFLVGEELGY